MMGPEATDATGRFPGAGEKMGIWMNEMFSLKPACTINITSFGLNMMKYNS